MTTSYRDGRFWVVTLYPFGEVETVGSFATFKEAKDWIGSRWVEPPAPDGS